jgi:hypothetical protein
MQIEEKESKPKKGEKWTSENILKEIVNQSKNGICVSRDMSLTGMARKRFGSWDESCRLAGVSSLRASRIRYEKCTIDGCKSEVRNETCQWCEKHYYRNRRNGDPNKLFLKQYTVDELFFDTWTPDMSWLLGLLWTDGWINGNSVGIKSKDLQLIECVKCLLRTDVVTQIEKERYYRITIASKSMVNRLKQIGMYENKTLSIGWPNGLPSEMKWHFLRGLLDGDGCVSFKQNRNRQQIPDCRLYFSTASITLHTELLDNIDLQCRESIRQPYKMKSGNFSQPFYKVNVDKQSDLRLLYERMYPTPSVPCLHRKRDLLKEFYFTPRAKAGNPLLKNVQKENRTCPICEMSFSALPNDPKISCSKPCGLKMGWKLRKQKVLERHGS